MLAKTTDGALMVLKVAAHVVEVRDQVPGNVLWIGRVLSRRPVIVAWETS